MNFFIHILVFIDKAKKVIFCKSIHSSS